MHPKPNQLTPMHLRGILQPLLLLLLPTTMLTTEPDPGLIPGTTTATTGVATTPIGIQIPMATTPIGIQIPMATLAPPWQLHGTLPILFKCITRTLGEL